MFRVVVIAALLVPGMGLGQGLTTAAEVKPIFAATKASWIAVREWEGQDLIYFTQIESWRCGVAEVRYAVNGGAEQVWAMDPCFTGTAQPNAVSADRIPYTVLPLRSVQQVDVVVVFEDGSSDRAHYERASVLMPG